MKEFPMVNWLLDEFLIPLEAHIRLNVRAIPHMLNTRFVALLQSVEIDARGEASIVFDGESLTVLHDATIILEAATFLVWLKEL